jgi:hypothetical protein
MLHEVRAWDGEEMIHTSQIARRGRCGKRRVREEKRRVREKDTCTETAKIQGKMREKR